MKKDKKGKLFCRNRIVLVAIIMAVIFGISMKIAYKYEWKEGISTPVIVENKTESAEENLEVSENTIIKEMIKTESDQMTGFSLYLGKLNESCENIKVKLKDSSGTLIKSWKLQRSDSGEEYYDFILDKEEKNIKNKEYTLELQFSAKEVVMLPLCKSNNSDAILSIDGGEKKNQIIGYQIFNGTHKSLRYFAFAMICGVMMCLAMVTWALVTKKDKAFIFVIVALIIGFMYICVIPPFAVPDEAAHFATTYSQSSKLMGKQATDSQGNILIEEQLWHRGNDATKDAYLDEVCGALKRGNNSQIIATRPPLSGVYLGYIPQVIGVTVARICGAGPIQIILTGRVFALIFYCLCMFYAIKLIPYNKQMLMIIGLFPMTLQQVMSYSYDAVIIDASFLLTAIVISKIDEKKEINKEEIILSLFLIAIIASIKFIYLAILLLALLIPYEVFNKKKQFYAIGAIAFSILVIMGTRLTSITDALGDGDAVLNNQVGKISLTYCLHNPIYTFELLWRTIERVSSDYLGQMVSTQLGDLCINTPNLILIGFLILFIISSIQVENQKVIANMKTRGLCIITFIIVGGLIIASLMFSWTPIGSLTIQGVQGRYFLPVLPLVGIAMQNRTIVLKKDITSNLILWAVFLNLYTIYFITLSALGK